ncbi:MAG: GFA family protein [Propionivibrio sp.]|uniref:GFA family protein n=1 Tax=Propionivibrio sp. TaxID=2212460 RepID=UPI001A36AB9E|nr:GFA family protein [Propionivibrio sp.]MBL8414702.1 GFA family protein [Propionivibrio sp.]
MHTGSCLCGEVEYEIDGALGPIVYCHCSRCRKSTGSAFTAVSRVASSDFRIVKGEEHLRSYRNDSGLHRVFCGACGSAIIGKRENLPEIVRVRIGTLDTPNHDKVSSHIFVDSKAEWENIPDDAPQYSEWPEG